MMPFTSHVWHSCVMNLVTTQLQLYFMMSSSSVLLYFKKYKEMTVKMKVTLWYGDSVVSLMHSLWSPVKVNWWHNPYKLVPLSMAFADGAALWTDKLGQHLLHERHSAVSTLCARAQNCSQEVIFTVSLQHVQTFKAQFAFAVCFIPAHITSPSTGIQVLCDLQGQTHHLSTSQQVWSIAIKWTRWCLEFADSNKRLFLHP